MVVLLIKIELPGLKATSLELKVFKVFQEIETQGFYRFSSMLEGWICRFIRIVE